jgi:predicted ATPase/DNA-binding winged helix-turn-helix (wHTH) protein
MIGTVAGIRDVMSFGRFRLVTGERLLTKDGAPVELGARTLDTLIALISRAGEPVGKRELMAQVWPDVTVEEGSLRFHIANLRKALGDGTDGARYIATLAGQGYCFVAPVSRSVERPRDPAAVAVQSQGATFLPARLARMLGREREIPELAALLSASRFVTVAGPGGVGKTTLAVAVAHDLLDGFDAELLFVDFGMLSDPLMVPACVASMLGMPIQSDDPTPSLVSRLHNRRLLLILDNCEHLIDAVAALAVRIHAAAPQVHILATSREALRVEGEHVYRLAPLSFAPDDPGLSIAAALQFPAARLFVERATAGGARLDLTDANAAILGDICRKLDGVPLAIELAAGRVQAYGLLQTAALLGQRLALLWVGQRTAQPRQQTLQATLDWSYGLLTELERRVFRRLAVFVGHFTVQAALAVVTDKTTDRALVFGAIDSLVSKSMLATRPAGAMMRYRLLETTRSYAMTIGIGAAELADLAARHAEHYRNWLEQSGNEWPSLSNAADRAPYLAGLGNVRAALEWCFGPDGDAEIGVGLAAAAVPVFLAMSLLTECHRWSERAILALDGTLPGAREEMQLQAALGMSLMFTAGSSESVRVALNRSLAIAEALGDARAQLRLLSTLNMFHSRIGDLATAMQCAIRGSAISRAIPDPAAHALAHALLGFELHFRGDLDAARSELDAALQHGPGTRQASAAYLGFDGYIIAGVALARTLWLQGHPDQAVDRARRMIAVAAALDHPVTLSVVLIWAVSVFLWAGDLDDAEKHADWFISRAEAYSLGPYRAVGRGFKGQLAIRRGNPNEGVEALRDSLAELQVARYEQVTTLFNISLAQGLAATGRQADGLSVIDKAIRRVAARGDLCYMPELLRVKGCVLLSMPEPDLGDAEACFTQSLEWSRRQTARSWELRTAIDLAAVWAGQGRAAAAQALLQPILEQFVGGSGTEDFKAAQRLLASLAPLPAVPALK